MGEGVVVQGSLFDEFSIERHASANHLLRATDRFVDLSGLRSHLKPFYSEIGRPSIKPELMLHMLIIGYCFGIRSERRPCEEVHLNLAYRWFCRLGLEGDVPDHSIFSKNRHGRFRDCDLCSLRPQCCPNTPPRKVLRFIRERARDIATTDAYITLRRQRKKVQMLFAHLQRILRLDRLRLREPNGARDESHFAVTAQNPRKLAELIPLPMPKPV